MNAICHIETPYIEKFGVPRQSLLVQEAIGKMVFPKNDFFTEAFRGLESFSHLWLIFEFHHVNLKGANALIRPPRFAGKKKLGVFATRSPHRPNRLGLSVVKFEKLEITENKVILCVSGVDLVNGTPILDIKPYIPYADAVPSATARDFELPPAPKKVEWLCEKPENYHLIEKVIALDPRPGHEQKSSEEYGVSIGGMNVRFQEVEETFKILSVKVLE